MANEWVHLTVAPDQLTAELWVSILEQEGIPAMILASDAVSFLGVSAMGCRIQVPAEYEEQARQALADVADA
jgi:hypothetical protein